MIWYTKMELLKILPIINTDKESFNRKLFAMVLPIAFQSFMTAAVSASDAIMLGFIEQESLSAVSLAGQLVFIINIIITVLMQGTSMLAAQYWGKGDAERVEMILGLAVRYSLYVLTLFSLATLFIPGQIMRIFTDDAGLIERGTTYLTIAGLSFVPLGVSQIYLCVMKNCGEIFRSTLIASSSLILNLLLNAILIYGLFGIPRLGIKGAAIGTVIATLIQFVWTIKEMQRERNLKIRKEFLMRTEPQLQSDFNRYTLPVVGNYFFWGGGVTLFTIIIGHLGNDAVAANSIANIVRNILSCMAKGVGIAAAILVGNELGRNMIDKAILYSRKAIAVSVLLGVVSGLVILLLRPLIFEMIHLTDTATEYLSGMLVICSYYIIAGAVNSTMIGGIFCAGGKSKFGCICDAVVLWLIISPLAAIAAFYWELPVLTVYFIICLDECVKVPVAFWYYRKYHWARNITRS